MVIVGSGSGNGNGTIPEGIINFSVHVHKPLAPTYNVHSSIQHK